MAICALVNALYENGVDMSQRSPDRPLENATTGIDAAETKMNIPRVFQPEDMVSASDELSCMTYISYFRDYDEMMRKRQNEEEARRRALELERTPDPSKCSASGLGLQGGEVNIPAEFVVTARNAAGRQITVGGATVTVDITAPDSTKCTEITVTDNGDGTYGIVYIPRVAGKNAVLVSINGAPITRAPIMVPILPPQPDPSKCTAHGPGVEGAMAGDPVEFVVQACNRIGDPIHVGGHPFKADVRGPFGEAIASQLRDNGDGTYTGTYEPVPGMQTVTITCAGRPIQGSPFSVPITADPHRAFAGKSYAFGPGVEGGCNTFDECPFTIQAVAPDGEKLTHGGDLFTVDVEDPEGTEVTPPPSVKDNGDGTYSVVYRVRMPGIHTVHVDLHHPRTPLYYELVKGSPYRVPIEPGLDPTKCECFGPGLSSGVVDTEPTTFTVKTKDCNGKDINKGGLPIEARVTDPSGAAVPTRVTDNGDGTYTVEYEPQSPGVHKVQVECKGNPIGKSPYSVEVEAGADTDHTGIGSFSFVVQARTRRGEPQTRGGDRMVAEVACKDPEYKGEATVIDNNDGTYTATYTVPGPGEYLISVTLNGRKIKGSPFKSVLP